MNLEELAEFIAHDLNKTPEMMKIIVFDGDFGPDKSIKIEIEKPLESDHEKFSLEIQKEIFKKLRWGIIGVDFDDK